MSKKITDLSSGTPSDTSLGFIGDPSTGALTHATYLVLKNYFQSGSNLSLTGSFVTTSSFNSFSGSYHNDSASFHLIDINLALSQSGFTPTSSYNPFTASYFIDSSSFDARIRAISGSMLTGSFVKTIDFSVYSASVSIDSASFYTKINNVFASESGYTPTASFNSFSASYVVDSASFGNRINNVFASESNYTPTSSFNIFSSSYATSSASFNVRINNVFASESNYLPTSSINGNNGFIAVFSGSQALSFGTMFQSGSSILINQINGSNNSLFQVAGPVSINDTSYLQLPRGATAQRPSGSVASFAMLRGNTDTTNLEFFNGSQWINLGSGSGIFTSGSVTSVGLSLPGIFGVANSPIVGADVLSASFNVQNSGTFFAAPAGANGVPVFRAITISDISALTSSFIGNFVLTSSFNAFTSSYVTSSASFDVRINNVFASESNYTTTSSFNTFSASYHTDSGSFYTNINNVYASESNYLLTSSFLTFSGSYFNDSASFTTKIANTFASESNFLPSSSVRGVTNFLPVFNSTSTIITSSIFQSGSSYLIGTNLTGSNNALLQIVGNTSLSGGLFDSSNTTGSSGQVLASVPGGLLWISTGSGDWLLSGNVATTASFLGTTNAQDLIFKRNSIQMALFGANNNVILGNSNNTVTGSNAFVAGGSNNFAANMSAVIDGSNNIAAGNSSVVIGGSNNNTIGASTVILGGTNLSASAAFSVALGRFNDPIISSNTTSWIGSDPLLILGNGSSTSSLSNALVVFKTGSISLPFYSNTVGGLLSVSSTGVVGIVPDLGANGFIPLFSGSQALTSSVISQIGITNILMAASLAMGVGNTSSGLVSFTQGSSNIASGSFSHAEGIGSFALGAAAHAEGANSTASGSFSHAEGNITKASGLSSHTEGTNTLATGVVSHAEGTFTTASGDSSHSEGSGSIARGFASHAEGNNTVASGNYQNVIGQYNTLNNNTSLFIIGNGSGLTTSSRSDLALFNSQSIQFNQDLFLSKSLHVSGAIFDSFNTTGTPGQILSSVPGGVQWVDVSGSSGINGFVTNGTFGAFTSSYFTDSSSLYTKINNVFASESNFLLTSSYIIDSASFNTRINNISSSLLNLTGSYVTTGSFNTYTASITVLSSSINTKINNVFASESNFLPTSSLVGLPNYIALFNTTKTLSTGSLYQSGSSVLVGGLTGSNNSLFQVFGNIYISKSLVDSVGSTGSSGQVLSSTTTGIKWVTSGSGGGASGSSSAVLNFIIGDGGSFTPISGSTKFSGSGNPLINRTILQFFQEGALMAPVSRSIAYYSFTSSQGIINLNNASFDQDTFYSVLYV